MKDDFCYFLNSIQMFFTHLANVRIYINKIWAIIKECFSHSIYSLIKKIFYRLLHWNNTWKTSCNSLIVWSSETLLCIYFYNHFCSFPKYAIRSYVTFSYIILTVLLDSWVAFVFQNKCLEKQLNMVTNIAINILS